MKFYKFKDSSGNLIKMKKEDFRKGFEGTERLFDWCWKRFVRDCCANGMEIEEVKNWLETFAAESVNNPRSSFYIYG